MYVHVGLPKTGTTAIQRAFWAGRQQLRAAGVVYPSQVVSSDPKHQGLVHALRVGSAEHLGRIIEAAVAETGPDTTTLVYSSEGIGYNLPRMPRESYALLGALAQLCTLKAVAVVRSRAAFVRSLYQQALRNPPNEPEWARAWSPREFVEDPHVAAVLDYEGLLTTLRDIVGRDGLHVLAYGPDVVLDVSRLVAADAEALPTANDEVNRSLPAAAVEVLRLFRQGGGSEDDVQRAVDLLHRLRGGADTQLFCEEDAVALDRRQEAGDRRVELEYGLPVGYISRVPALA